MRVRMAARVALSILVSVQTTTVRDTAPPTTSSGTQSTSSSTVQGATLVMAWMMVVFSRCQAVSLLVGWKHVVLFLLSLFFFAGCVLFFFKKKYRAGSLVLGPGSWIVYLVALLPRNSGWFLRFVFCSFPQRIPDSTLDWNLRIPRISVKLCPLTVFWKVPGLRLHI